MKNYGCVVPSAILILIMSLGLTGCGGGNGGAPSGNPGVNPGSGTTYTAGQSSTYLIYEVKFNMHYVPGGLTFPTDHDDKTIGTPTVADAYWIAETEATYQLWDKVKTWATTIPYEIYTFSLGGHLGSSNAGSYQQPVLVVTWRNAMIWCNALTEYYNYRNGTNYACVYCTDTTYTTPIRSCDDIYPDASTIEPGKEDNPYINPAAKGFRLPTSNEWELAARYKDGINWTPGNYASGATADYNDVAATAAVAVIRPQHDTGRTAVVKSKIANALGLYDMSGNAFEWCFDWHPDHKNEFRVSRGGSYIYTGGSYLGIGHVKSYLPSQADTLSNEDGFRFVRTQ